VTSPAGLSLPGVGVVPPPALETLPEAIVRNVAIARSRTGCPPHEWDTLIARATQGQARGKIRVVGLILNEVNTMPGMTAESQVPRMFAAAGVSYEELVARLIDAATVPAARPPSDPLPCVRGSAAI
jgi:hypothetical protein